MTRRSHARSRRLPALGLAVFLMGACSEAPSPDPEVAELPSVRLAWLPHLAHAPLAIALEEGYFEDEGLRVETIQLGSRDALVALSQERVDVTSPWLSIGLFNAIQKGEGVRIVADKAHIDGGCSPYSFVARSDLLDEGALNSVKDVKGMTFEYPEGSIMAFAVETMLRQAGLTTDDIRNVSIFGPAVIDALENGSIDIEPASEPLQTVVVESGAGRIWKPFRDVVPGQQISVIVFGSQIWKDKPDLGRRFMIAYLRGVRQYAEGKTDRNIEIISRFANLEPDLLRKTCWAPIDANGQINIESVDRFLAWAHERDLLGEVVPPGSYWEDRFVRHASAELARRDGPKKP